MGNAFNWGTAEAAASLTQLKNQCRIDGSGEDAHLADLLEWAAADARAFLGVLVMAAEVDEAVNVGRNESCLKLKNRPVDSTATITVLDPDGDEWDATYFTLDARNGLLKTPTTYGQRDILPEGTWTVTYTGGLSLEDDYSAVISPLLERYTILKAADDYLNRNPSAASERDGDVSLGRDVALQLATVERSLGRYRRAI